MESHRTSLVFRNLQELGRRAVAQLSKDSQLPSYHLDQDWFGSVCLSRPRSLSNRPQCGSPTLPLHSSSPPQDTTGLELHDHSQSVKLFLRGPLFIQTIRPEPACEPVYVIISFVKCCASVAGQEEMVARISTLASIPDAFCAIQFPADRYYKDAFSDPLLRLTLDWRDNERKMAEFTIPKAVEIAPPWERRKLLRFRACETMMQRATN